MGRNKLSNCRSSSASRAQRRRAANNGQPILAVLKTQWSEFYRAQVERLSRIAAEMGVSPDRITVVLQEVWLDLTKHPEAFQGQDADPRLASWLGVVVRSKSRNMLRRLRRERAESLNNLPAELVDSKADDPAELMEAMERNECVAAVLEKLREKDPLNCHLVHEHILQGRSLADLAAETGLGIHAISCRIDRTLHKLGIQLSEWRPNGVAEKRSAAKTHKRK